MTTLFPGSVDSFVNPSAGSQLSDASAPHNAQHDNLNDAMLAVQRALIGTVASSVVGSFNGIVVGAGTATIASANVYTFIQGQGAPPFGALGTASMGGILASGPATLAGGLAVPSLATVQALTVGLGNATIAGQLAVVGGLTATNIPTTLGIVTVTGNLAVNNGIAASSGLLITTGTASLSALQVLPSGTNNVTTLLFSQIVGSAQATMGTASIGGNYSHLKAYWQGRSSYNDISQNVVPTLVLNSLGAGNYTGNIQSGIGASVTAANLGIGALAVCGALAAASAAPSIAAGGVIDINRYAGTTFFKPITFSAFTPSMGGGAGFNNGTRNDQGGGQFLQAGAITSLYLNAGLGSWVAGSSLHIYGLP